MLKANHIQHYPLGGENALNCINQEDGEILKLEGIVNVNNGLVLFANGKEWDYVPQIKPLLRPMSDLYKERNGKFDIVELIHILSKADDSDKKEAKIIKSENDCIVVYKTKFSNIKEIHTSLHYYEGKWMFFQNGELGLFNQLDLFQYLFENHYDVFCLHEKGLAIDINTIKP